MGLWETSGIESASDALAQQRAPVLVWVVVIATLISNLTGDSIFGFQVSGFGWFIPLIFAIYALYTTPGRPRFPLWIWVPWFGLTIGYLVFASAENALQRTVMLLTPIVIGLAVSKATIGALELARIESTFDKFSIAFFAAILVNSGLVSTGVLPEVTGLAPQSVTAALFGTFFAAQYALGRKRAAIKWLLFAAVPVIAVTRTAIVAAGLTLPLTFAPLSLWKRIAILVCVAALGFLTFNTERMQNKMFYSGAGTVFDLRWDNPDLRTSGRTLIMEIMEREIEESPWFGHGANASEQFISDHSDGQLAHPHNDYLRLAFDYGYTGILLFIATIVFQMLHALRSGYRSVGAARLFLIVGSGAFIPFALLMGTDNIILYVAFFGNLHFMMLGAGYAARASEDALPTYVGFR